MINEIFVYKSDSFDPYINLAAEKHLLLNTPGSAACLMLWQNENTVVIGINQNPHTECRCAELFESGGRLARRESGGGAVFHDLGNLNFSIIAPSTDFDVQKNLSVISRACSLLGIDAKVSGRNDITADGFKFSGNAFLHKNGMSLHHGTLLINADLDKMTRFLSPPETKLRAKGVKSVRSRVTNLSALSEKVSIASMSACLVTAFSEVFGHTALLKPMPDKKLIMPQAEIYKSEQFLFGKTVPFTAEFSGRCDFGEMNIRIDVKDGKINTVQVYTDSLDTDISDVLKNALIGVPFNKSAIDAALADKNLIQLTEIIKL